ncbi:uncharacterized protein TNCV_2513671 [Trichonephila clavipes]|nr:uncharacterized protein TNCV_2513671 [Trichonephila clavipes]
MRSGIRKDTSFTKKSIHGSAGYSTGATVRRMTFSIRTKTERCKTICSSPPSSCLPPETRPHCLKCRAQPNLLRRSCETYDQMLYHRTILEPHTAYPIPAGTNYIVLTVQKTAFGLDIIPKYLLPHLVQKGFHVGDFRKMKKFDQTPYKLPPPTPIHVPAKKRPLEEKSLPSPRNDPKCASLPS